MKLTILVLSENNHGISSINFSKIELVGAKTVTSFDFRSVDTMSAAFRAFTKIINSGSVEIASYKSCPGMGFTALPII